MRSVGHLLVAAPRWLGTEMGPDYNTARAVEVIIKAIRILPARREDIEQVIPASSCNVSGETNAKHHLEDRDPGPSTYVDGSKVRGQGFMPESGFLGGIKQLVERFRPRKTAGEAHG